MEEGIDVMSVRGAEREREREKTGRCSKEEEGGERERKAALLVENVVPPQPGPSSVQTGPSHVSSVGVTLTLTSQRPVPHSRFS